MLTATEIVDGIESELAGFAALIRSLDDREWILQSRCAGWTVADVAGHLVGAFADLTQGRVEGQGTDEASERQAAERRGRTQSEIAHELDGVAPLIRKMLLSFDDATWSRPAPGGYDMTVAGAFLAMWSGAYVHADDIRAAVGKPSARGPGLRATVHNIAEQLASRGWGPAVLALDGMEEVLVKTGGGAEARSVTGDPLAFVLAATGRADPETLGLDPSVNVFA